MSEPWTIGEARSDEFALFDGIEREASRLFATAGQPLAPADDAAADGFYEAFREAGLALVARVANRPVGFVVLAPLAGEAHLWELGVVPAHQRHGIGRALLAAAEAGARARGYKTLSLSTFRGIAWNAPFYARHGYAIVPRSKYPPAFHLLAKLERLVGLEDRCIMVKALQ